tara:strand:+ start:833 stop:1120 length:288 start_codon:yes stop_codon:yes gene_type:complete
MNRFKTVILGVLATTSIVYVANSKLVSTNYQGNYLITYTDLHTQVKQTIPSSHHAESVFVNGLAVNGRYYATHPETLVVTEFDIDSSIFVSARDD